MLYQDQGQQSLTQFKPVTLHAASVKSCGSCTVPAVKQPGRLVSERTRSQCEFYNPKCYEKQYMVALYLWRMLNCYRCVP